jgi:uncharacterized protein YbjT (DUF2867 family)
MIVVTGSTGHVGRLVAEELAERGEPMRLLVRDVARAPDLPGAEVVPADYGDPAGLAAVLREGDRVFMVSLHEGPERRVALHRSFVEGAVRAGVAHVVYLSFLGAGKDAVFLHARSHGATEAMLSAAGLSWTAIRNGMYADEIPGWFDADRVLREDGGDGRLSFSYRPELAKAITVALLGPVPPVTGEIYDIVTPPPVSLAELARIASEVTGRHYRYEPAPSAWWDERWTRAGRSGWQLESGHTSYEAIRSGELDVVSDDFHRLTGIAPLMLGEVIARHADALPL